MDNRGSDTGSAKLEHTLYFSLLDRSCPAGRPRARPDAAGGCGGEPAAVRDRLSGRAGVAGGGPMAEQPGMRVL